VDAGSEKDGVSLDWTGRCRCEVDDLRVGVSIRTSTEVAVSRARATYARLCQTLKHLNIRSRPIRFLSKIGCMATSIGSESHLELSITRVGPQDKNEKSCDIHLAWTPGFYLVFVHALLDSKFQLTGATSGPRNLSW